MTVRDTANLGDIFHRDHGAAGPSARLVLTDCRDWDAPREWTQVKLEAAADACGRGLLGTGLKPGDAVVMLSANSAQFLVAFLGILRAGLVAVPINHKFPPDTVAFIMGDAAAKAIICDGSRRERVDALATGLPVFDFDDGSFDAMCDPGPLDIYDAGADGIAMVLYTSGSTGRPKGVALTHAGHVWAHNYRVAKAGNQTGERFLVAAPLYHMNALCTTLFAFGVDAEVVLLPEFTTHSYIDAISRFKCSMLTCVPPMLAMCLAEPGLIENADLSSVRSVRMGSAPVSANLWARVSAAFPGAQLTNVYGTTEAGPVVFGPRPGKVAPQSSVGWPADGVDLRLVGRDGKDAEEGELWQRTPAAMAGYLNLPEKTTEVFSKDGFYKSGDVFRRDPETGAFQFVGRVDDMFNCGGENIYPGEVEATLMTHPEVEMACVVPVPDDIKGMKPVAFVVLMPGAHLGEEELKKYALARAPAYQHPRRVFFLDRLPLMGPGKIDRKGLGATALELWAKAPDSAAE